MTIRKPESAIIKIDGIDTIVPLSSILKSAADLYERSSATRATIEAAIAKLIVEDAADDDLVKRAKHNAMADMPHYASVALIEEMANRIKELKEMVQAANDAAEQSESYVAALDAMLAMATWTFESILKIPNSETAQGMMKAFARAALREMGEDDDGR